MIITTDDFCPKFMHMWKYWEKLKNKWPSFRLTAFIVPNWEGKFPVNKSREFRDWYESNKDWVEVAMHGFDHSFAECQKYNGKKLQERLTNGFNTIRDFLPDKWGFKPPYYKYNSECIDFVLEKLGAEYFMTLAGMITKDHRLQRFPVIESHTNDETKMNDRIDKIHKIFLQLNPYEMLGELNESGKNIRQKTGIDSFFNF